MFVYASSTHLYATFHRCPVTLSSTHIFCTIFEIFVKTRDKRYVRDTSEISVAHMSEMRWDVKMER